MGKKKNRGEPTEQELLALIPYETLLELWGRFTNNREFAENYVHVKVQRPDGTVWNILTKAKVFLKELIRRDEGN